MERTRLNSVPYRENRDMVLDHAETSADSFEKDLTQSLHSMFGSNIELEAITPEERSDIINFARFASKRIATGAVSSPAQEKHMHEGKISAVLNSWAPQNFLPHDAVHAMFAYSRTNGRSLEPAYQLVQESGAEYNDELANLEEERVLAMLDPSLPRKIFERLGDRADNENEETEEAINKVLGKGVLGPIERIRLSILKKTNPVLWGTLVWEAVKFSDRSDRGASMRRFANSHRDPNFLTLMGNVYKDTQAPKSDPNLMVKEFLRITSPLKERLRREAAKDEEKLAA